MRTLGLSDELFQQISTYLFQETGITINKNKKYLVEYRLQKFVGPDKKFTSYYALFQALKEDPRGELKTLFINCLPPTIHFFLENRCISASLPTIYIPMGKTNRTFDCGVRDVPQEKKLTVWPLPVWNRGFQMPTRISGSLPAIYQNRF
jgi:hypothetical protein